MGDITKKYRCCDHYEAILKIEDRVFCFPQAEALLVLRSAVLEHMYKYTQSQPSDNEAGGQLFSRNISENVIVVEEITGPYKKDDQSRTHWKPNKKQLIADRESMFSKGLHVVGLWHTHPEPIPHPSFIDRDTCEAHLRLLDSAYTGFLMLTLGNVGAPPNLSVYLSMRNEHSWKELIER